MKKQQKPKKTKVKKTPKQKFITFLKVFASVLAVIAILFGIATCGNILCVKSVSEFIQESFRQVRYENQLKPKMGNDGSYEFVTDGDFKIMQLTDIHLGGGFLSRKKDIMAFNAMEAMIKTEKPDLVVVTGDIAFPIPYSSGTVNNKRPAVLFADFMEKLGVYWCLAFGNHDTEAYSFFSREEISEIYENHEKYPHCLFQRGPETADGCGNYVINIKNSEGKITQCLFMIDSHSYTDHDWAGILWKYDCVHKNQIEWYEKTLEQLKEENGSEMPKSLMFMHIPVLEMRDAYYEYRDNGFKDTKDSKFVSGEMGEHKKIVYSSDHNDGLFDACLKYGSTQGIFFGHDHLNNMTLDYKGIMLSYGYSIDYLAYGHIKKYGAQRGCTVINVSSDSSFEINHENYYQDKYVPVMEKEEVTMEKYYNEDE